MRDQTKPRDTMQRFVQLFVQQFAITDQKHLPLNSARLIGYRERLLLEKFLVVFNHAATPAQII